MSHQRENQSEICTKVILMEMIKNLFPIDSFVYFAKNSEKTN